MHLLLPVGVIAMAALFATIILQASVEEGLQKSADGAERLLRRR